MLDFPLLGLPTRATNADLKDFTVVVSIN
jgi:hypothetical protein